MDPVLRILSVVIGAFLGASLGAPTQRVFSAVLGALAALGIAEFIELRSRVAVLQAEVARLKTGPRRPQDAEPPTPAADAPDTPTVALASQPLAAAVVPRGLLNERIESEATELTASELPWQETELAAPDERPEPPEPPESAPREQPPAGIPGAGTLLRFFLGGNTVVRAGVVILFFGVAFLLRYMAEHTHLPVEVRLTGIAVAAIILLVLGWRLRTTRAGYALALQGGGTGILYLTVFAALRLYAILPAAAAFPMLAMIAALSAMLAVKQDSMSLALLGITGGFLAPVLASTGDGSHVVLFSYYALLNAGILAMAWFKAWRPLNIAGFIFTFAIGTVWGVLRYRPEAFASTEPFLILFFLFYFAIAILFTVRQPAFKGFVDGTLIFGTPIVVFALQSLMLSDRLMSLAFSAIGLSAVYLVAAFTLQRRRDAARALMIEAFIAIGVAFLTLAIPLALDARWNAAAWTLEGAALVWVGCRQNRVLARAAGALLIVASEGITTFGLDLGAQHFVLPFASYFEAVLQSVAAIFAAQTLHAHRDRLRSLEPVVPHALFWLGLFGWFGAGVGEIAVHWPGQLIPGSLILGTFTALACSGLHRLTRFDDAKFAALLQLPMMFVAAVFTAGQAAHPFANSGWLAWPLAFIGLYAVIYRHEGMPNGRLATSLACGASWLFCGVFSWEVAWTVNEGIAGGKSWPDAAWAVIPGGLLFLLPRLVTRMNWPFAKNREAYLSVVGVGVAAYLAMWSFWTSVTSSGDSAPLPYLPFLNPQDLAQALVLLILVRHWKLLRSAPFTRYVRFNPGLPIPVVSALAFLWLNAALLRTLHQWFGVELELQAMIDSTLVQTSLSIFWAIIAFVTMLVGARRGRRRIWIVGAALLGVVIAKLFLVDLSRIGSIERIVSFVGVGLLMLVVGYLSPLPPAKEPSV